MIKFKCLLKKSIYPLIILITIFSIGMPLAMDVASAKAKLSTQKVIKNVNGSVTQSMSVILKPRNLNQLDSFIYQTTTPGNSNYRRFITPRQFAGKYGQSNAKVKAVVNYFNYYGLKATVNAGNLVVNVSGTTKNFNRALKIKLQRVKDKDGISQKVNRTPRFTKAVKGSILDIVGLAKDNLLNANNAYRSNAIEENFSANRKDGRPQKFMDRYGMDNLYKQNHLGSGQSIGIISFGNYMASDVYHFWNKMGIPYQSKRLNNFHTTSMDHVADSSETTLDIEQAGAIAPRAKINVYMSQPSVEGMVNSLASSISSNQNSSLSISWGQSEHRIKSEIKNGTVPKHYNEIMNVLMMQAAAQGISVFAATGDSGAYDGMSLEEEYPYVTVDTPANSPYVTAVGGTTLPSQYTVNGNTVTVMKERAWGNEYLYPKYRKDKAINSNISKFIDAYFVGGGGGFSTFNTVPAYQNGVSGVGTFQARQLWGVNDGFLYSLASPKLITGSSAGRNLPDVSANADPNTGYYAYYHGSLITVGGTSVVAPQFAGASAVINSAHNKRIGFWNPPMYRLAQQNNSPFTPLNSDVDNTNLYYIGQPGKLYNQATGLGTVNFSQFSNLLN